LRDFELREVEVLFERDPCRSRGCSLADDRRRLQTRPMGTILRCGALLQAHRIGYVLAVAKTTMFPPHRAYVLVRMPVTTADASGNLSCRRRLTP
jgi:hypothetical protein